MFWPSTNLMTSSILFFVAQHRREGVIESLDALDERWRDLDCGVHHEARGGNRQMPWEHGDLPHDLVSLAAHAAVVRQPAVGPLPTRPTWGRRDVLLTGGPSRS